MSAARSAPGTLPNWTSTQMGIRVMRIRQKPNPIVFTKSLVTEFIMCAMFAPHPIHKIATLAPVVVRPNALRLYGFRMYIASVKTEISANIKFYRPKKVKREPDPDLVRSVEEKLAAMAITPKPAVADG